MSLPKHLAIIMDGNGRWAQLRNHPRTYGHIKGTRVAKNIITECSKIGIKNLTLYAFSAENWLRPKAEVNFLMKLLQRYLKKETENLVKENIKFSVIGNLTNVPKDVLFAIDQALKATSKCTGLHLVFALGYGSRQEITQAVQSIAEKVKSGELNPSDINESTLNSHLETFPMPDPDLIVRTSGELRLSNFLLWQAAYSEFYFTDKLWPDFKKSDLHEALKDYSQRQRRFGRVKNSDEHLTN